MSLNKVMLIGNLGADPEVKYTDGGEPVANFNIATSERWVGKDGKGHEDTQWHRIVVWGKQAEACGEYLAKGRQVYVEGKLVTREWVDKEGARRWTTEVKASRVQFLGGGKGDRNEPSTRGGHGEAPF